MSKLKNDATQLDLVEIQGREWDAAKLAEMKKFIREQSTKRSPEQVLENEFRSIRYQMEDYVEQIEVKELCTVDSFVDRYLQTLNISFRMFSSFLGTTDSNLKKYVSGKRKLNPDLANKLGGVFKTSPDIWLRIQMKNDLLQLTRGLHSQSRYVKYNPERLLKYAKQK